MIRGRFVYDDATHTYWVCGKRYRYELPGTTEIMTAGGFLAAKPFYTADGRSRGTRVHDVIETVLMGLADVEDLEEVGDIGGYVRGALRVIRESGLQVTLVEAPVVSRRLGFATKVDVIGILDGQPVTLNWKTGAEKGEDAIQSALEVLAIDGKITNRRRLTCYLRKRNDARLREHLGYVGFDEAMEAIRLWREHDHDPQKHPPLRLLDRATLADARSR